MKHISSRINEFLPKMTGHANIRMESRGISLSDVAIAMSYGRTFYVRGAVIYALGRKEIASCRGDGIQTNSIEGLQVICSSDSEQVITVYRNNDFRRLRRRNTRWSPEKYT